MSTTSPRQDQALYPSSLHSSSNSSRSSNLFLSDRVQHSPSPSEDSLASSVSDHSPHLSHQKKKKITTTTNMSSSSLHQSMDDSTSSLDSKKRKGSPGSEHVITQSPSSKSQHRHKDSLEAGAGSDSSAKDSPANGEASSSKSSQKKAEAAAAQQAAKRIKTARACDSCRRKKIRCDVLDDGSTVMGNPNNGNSGLICAHCKQYGFDCTFFLPITETRFKKKKEREAEERAAAAAAAAAAVTSASMAESAHLGPMHGSQMMRPGGVAFMESSFGSLPTIHQSSPVYTVSVPSAPLESHPSRISATQEWPRPPPDMANRLEPPMNAWQREVSPKEASVSPVNVPKTQGSAGLASSHDIGPPPPDTRVLGPTSIAYIVHSTAFVPGAAIEQHDLKHHQTFEVGASGDGIIKFHKPPKSHAAMSDGEDAGDGYDIDKIPESIRGRLAGDVAEKLVNVYFEKIGHLFPVMTKSEFLHLSPPPPLLLYSICGVAALSRDVPKEVLAAVKMTLNSLFRDMDLLSNSNNNTVKALLIMSLHNDLHGNTAVQGGTRCWNRVGTAIRMAQDLGLHRDASGRDDLDDDAFFLEQKRRIWGCCVTADRCMSVSLGHPLAIDLTDCDVRLPSPHEILRYPTDPPTDPTTDRPFAYNTEMLKLSILFGRVMKTVYSPTGLMKTNDNDIIGLLTDIDRWKENLPAPLQFKGPTDSSVPAGILHVSFACLLHLLFRVFMRISYNCPKHLSVSLTIERMTKLIQYSRESIEWVDLNDFYLDTLQFVSYGLVFCTTIQYHAWIRRGDHHALATLKRARECVTRFKRQGEHDASEELSMRAKTAEVITMLHDSALGAYANGPNTGNLNPTAGVTNRRTTDTVRGIVFKPDMSRPGGGVYVATNPNLMLNDLPKGTVILQETEGGRVPALVRTDQESNGGWRPIEAHTNATNVDLTRTNHIDGTNRGPSGGAAAGGVMGQSSSSSTSRQHLEGSPAAPDLTYVAGDVWTDAEGRPVNRRGSRLMTMIPVQSANMDTAGQQYLTNAMPRLSFSDISGVNGPTGSTSTPPPMGTNNNKPSGGDAAGSSSLALNDAAWLNAMTNSLSSNSGSFPNMVSFNDGNYSFDGQPVYIPAHLFSGSGVSGGGSGSAYDGRLSGMSSMTTPGISSASLPFSFSVVGGGAGGGGGGSGGLGGGPSGGMMQTIDPLSLDEMPGGPLDFAAWDSWFRTASTFNADSSGATGGGSNAAGGGTNGGGNSNSNNNSSSNNNNNSNSSSNSNSNSNNHNSNHN